MAVKDAWQLLDAKPVDRFYVAADVSEIHSIPTQMITTMFKEYGKTHPSFGGLTILVGAPVYMQRLVKQFQSIFHTSNFGFADQVCDLDAVIAQHVQHH